MLNKSITQDLTLFVARIVAGAFMLPHGWSKFSKIMEGNYKFPDPIGIGEKASLFCTAGAEFFGSILLIAGLLTRFSAGALLFTMLVAGLIHHWADPMDDKEVSLIYAIVYLLILVFGAGKFSADYLIKTYLLKK